MSIDNNFRPQDRITGRPVSDQLGLGPGVRLSDFQRALAAFEGGPQPRPVGDDPQPRPQPRPDDGSNPRPNPNPFVPGPGQWSIFLSSMQALSRYKMFAQYGPMGGNPWCATGWPGQLPGNYFGPPSSELRQMATQPRETPDPSSDETLV